MTRQIWVVDCSMAAAFLLSDEDGASMDPLIARAMTEEIRLVIPSLFWFELLNVLVIAERRGRITHHQAVCLCSEVDRLPLETDPPLGPQDRARVHGLAAKHGLTVYDAAYLELADRRGARLKTLDEALLALREEYSWIE